MYEGICFVWSVMFVISCRARLPILVLSSIDNPVGCHNGLCVVLQMGLQAILHWTVLGPGLEHAQQLVEAGLTTGLAATLLPRMAGRIV